MYTKNTAKDSWKTTFQYKYYCYSRRFGDIFAIFDYGATASPIEPWPIIGGGWDSGTVTGSVTSNNSYDYGSIASPAENV